jgi:hypothetical protein
VNIPQIWIIWAQRSVRHDATIGERDKTARTVRNNRPRREQAKNKKETWRGHFRFPFFLSFTPGSSPFF